MPSLHFVLLVSVSLLYMYTLYFYSSTFQREILYFLLHYNYLTALVTKLNESNYPTVCTSSAETISRLTED